MKTPPRIRTLGAESFWRTTSRCCVVLSLLGMYWSSLAAQSARPTNDILFKTLMIKSETEAGTVVTGTMFCIDVDNRAYWLTAKHILTGRKTAPAGEVNRREAMLDVLDPIGTATKWISVRFTVIDPGNNIDIVVLVPKTNLQEYAHVRPLKVSFKNTAVGGECSFLGFPFASTWTAGLRNPSGSTTRYKMPYIKHCYISGMISTPVPVLLLDGINNRGFSGGPVLYNTGTRQVVIGVVSGYRPDPAEVHSVVVPNTSTAAAAPQVGKTIGTKKEEVVDLNSGIILAYLANSAVQAIRKDPIGRPLAPN